MFKGIMAVLIAVLVLQGGLSGGAAAQAGNNCPWIWVSCDMTSLWNLTCSLPQGATNCWSAAFSFTVNCQVPPQCAPAAGAGENAGGKSCPHCGSPISLVSGNTFIEENDVSVPGLSNGLTLSRTWNSMWPSTQSAYQIGLFGPNWRSNFEERVFLGGDNYVKYGRGDGSFWSFAYSGSSGAITTYSVVAPANGGVRLSSGSSYWTMTFQNGEQRLFDNTSGKLTAIIDRNGNTTHLSYDSLSRLTTVTDPAARHLYFSYGNGSSYLVTSVTSDVGLAVAYTYDNQGRLSQVTEPDGSTLSFQYDSNSLVSAVLDSQGKILESHTYDSSGRGLTASRANGVDAVSISYGNP